MAIWYFACTLQRIVNLAVLGFQSGNSTSKTCLRMSATSLNHLHHFLQSLACFSTWRILTCIETTMVIRLCSFQNHVEELVHAKSVCTKAFDNSVIALKTARFGHFYVRQRPLHIAASRAKPRHGTCCFARTTKPTKVRNRLDTVKVMEILSKNPVSKF